MVRQYYSPDEGCNLSEKKCSICGKVGDRNKEMQFVNTREHGVRWYCNCDLGELTVVSNNGVNADPEGRA